MRQAYINKKFKPQSMDMIATISSILNEYIKAGYAITVRSLYYQMVAREYIPNNERSYKMLTNLISDARLAGLLDWEAIEDRMRAFVTRNRYNSGKDILKVAYQGFHMDLWDNQPNRAFCIIEKDALSGIVAATCSKHDVPMLAARGYPSSSVVREFVKDVLIPASQSGQDIIILHMGDHDPSGIDMSRDLEDRILLFSEGLFNCDFRRLALNMDQIEEFNPPENPAKSSDSRFNDYAQKFGDSSWELDALSPKYTNKILDDAIVDCIDPDMLEIKKDEIENIRAKLKKVYEGFDD